MAYASRAGVHLYYDDIGDGPAVVLHTGGAGDGLMWEQAGYVAALDGHRLLMLDHRGHGRSDRPSEVSAHRVGQYVDDVIAVLDAASVERAALVGYSAGATVAYGVAAHYPSRIAALVGLGTVSAPDEDLSEYSSYAAEVRARDMRASMEEDFAASEPQPPPGWLIDNLATTEPEMFALLLEGWAAGPSEWDNFPQIQAPVLLICGELESAGNAGKHAEEAVSVMPDGTALVLPGLAHLQTFWRTDLTIPPIQSFLGQQAAW